MSAASNPNAGSATGITVLAKSEANCGANIIRATVYSNSPEAAARGISTNESSVVRAHNNDITATVISAELPKSCEGGVNTEKIATGISVKGGSTGILCEGNIIHVTVDSDSQNATAIGISVDESSIITADKNDITATTIIRGPGDNCKITSGMSSNGAIGLFKSGYTIVANFVGQHPYISCALLCGFIATTAYLAYRYLSKPGIDGKGQGNCPRNTHRHSTRNLKGPRWTRQYWGGAFEH